MLNYNNYITIPKRSERIVSILIDTHEEMVCKAREIRHGVFVGNNIIKQKNGLATISIINTTTSDVKLEVINLDLAPISQYNILNIQENEEGDNRFEKVLNNINLNSLNGYEKDPLIPILEQYQDLFYLEGALLSHTDTIQHAIELDEGAKPINIKPYRFAMSQRQEINRQVEKLLEQKKIEVANSPWNSPLILVPKRSNTDEKKFRLVVDLRGANSVTVGDCFPMPNITEILESLGKSRYFTTLDMAAGYHQIKLEENSRKITAFSTGTCAHSGKKYG